jgi:hypothetical protein
MRYQLVFDMPQEKVPFAEEFFNAVAFIKKATLAPFAEKPYDPEFVEKIEESRRQIARGQYKAIATEDLWK